MRHRFAHEIVVDSSKNEIRFDGIAFPYWVDPDPEIELPKEGQPYIGLLRIGIYADSIVYVGKDGDEKRLLEASPAAELEWARARGREIAIEGLADVIEWLGQCEVERQQKEARREVRQEAYERIRRAGEAHHG